jgi:uncharacterized ParB-like nuclease family protein
LTSLTIGNSVTSIGSGAFSGCSSLTSVTIPNSVTSIGNSAFSGCSGLTSVTIPNSVTTIGYYAFSGCSGLTSVTIPNSVTSIESSAFSGCNSLLSINVANNNLNYSSIAGVLFNKIATVLIFCPHGKTGAYIIPNSVTSIGGGAFSGCSGLTSVTIPNSVISIEDLAFSGCSGLTSITIPNSITSIRNYAFENCSSLKNVILQDGTDALSFASSSFADCPIESLYLGRNINSIFQNKTTLISLIIGNSVTSIESYAFQDCSGLIGTLNIPNSVTTIGYYAFSGCSGLTGALNIPNSVTYIGNNAFYNCSGLSSATISNSVTSIGYYAFSGCSGLTSVIIPNSVTSIANNAFYDCSSLKNVVLQDGTTTLSFTLSYSYSATAFENCPIENLYLGRNITYYSEDSPFKNKTSLTALNIGNKVTSIGNSAFSGCSSLMEISSKNPTPPQAQSNTFTGVDKQACTLYVPIGCTTTYSLNSVWEDFFNIQENNFLQPQTIIFP